jgi:hypothetical protein
MSAQSAPSRQVFTPEERCSFLSWRFGSTLDWSSRILVEINYPVEELRWFVDAVQGVCKGQERRIAHATLATRAARYKNPSQAKALAKRAITTDREWSRLHRRVIFDIEAPKPNEREGKDKRARTRYTDYLTAAAVRAQESEHRVKKSDELRWKKDSKFRFETRQKILAKAVALLPHFESVEDMPKTAQPKESQPLPLSDYVEQRERILLAENERVLTRVCEGELTNVDDINARLAALEVFHQRAMHELEKSYQSARDVLLGLKKSRMVRALNFTDPEEAVAPVDEILSAKGYADVPLSDDPSDTPADWLSEIVTPEPPAAAAPLSASLLNGNSSTKGYAGVPLSHPPADGSDEEFEEVLIGDDGKETAGVDPVLTQVDPALTQRDCALSYAALGQPVFPTKPDKSPYTARGFKEATTNEATIREWWEKHPDAGIGIPTGNASGLLVLDRDDRHGGDASLSELVEQRGDLPPTQQASTPSGGAHYVFKYPKDVHVGNSAGKLGKGLDIRGEGGYIVAPGCDPARRWENALDPADPPEWMIDALLSEGHAPINTDRNVFHSAYGGRRFFDNGERNKGLRDVACGRWLHGYAEDAQDLYQQVREVRDTRCAAGKDSPATDAQLLDLVQRTVRKFPRGEQRQQGSVV